MLKRQQEFLESIKSDDLGDHRSYTHAVYLPTEAKITVPPNNVAKFWEEYCEIVSEGHSVSLAERLKANAPLICDFRFPFHVTEGSPPDLPDDFILMLIACIQETILNIFIVGNAGSLLCCVLRPIDDFPEPGSETLTRTLRLQFPYVSIEPMAAGSVIFPQIIDLFRKRNVMGKLEAQPLCDWDKIFNSEVYHDPIMMYGSVKGTFEKPKLLNMIVGKVEKYHVDNNEPPEVDLDKVIAFANHADVRRGLIEPDKIEGDDKGFWLPFFLSVHYYDGALLMKNGQAPLRSSSRSSIKKEETSWDRVSTFLRMIPKDDKNIPYIWNDIGRVMYNESGGSDEGLEAWIKLTNDEIDDESLDEALCRDKYPTFSTNNKLTVKTLAWYARKYNPGEYNKWHKEKMSSLKESALSKLDTDVAEALYYTCWLDYTYATSPGKRTGGSWYRYRNHRWCKMDQALDISRVISTTFYKEFAQMSRELADQRASTNDEQVRDACTAKMAKVEMLLKKLKSFSPKRSIINEASTMFHDEHFEEVLDTNYDLMGHFNCVHEIVDDEIVFRDGKPEDYISKSTGVTYDHHMDDAVGGCEGMKAGLKHPRVQQFEKWMSQVFIDTEVRNSFMNWMASLLRRGNPDKVIPVCSGEGDNSKSMIEKLLEILLGGYAFKFDENTITGKASGGPSPELAQARNGALGIVDEVDENGVMKANLLKRISGGDSFFARMLHDNGGKIDASFKIMIICNNIPRMSSFQRAIKERMLFYPFESTWVQPSLAPQTEKEQYAAKCFPMNQQFGKEIPKMVGAVLWYLKERYPKYAREGIPRPAVVQKAAEDYWKDVDFYQVFKRECLAEAWVIDPKTNEKVRDREAKVLVDDCFREFKHWFKGICEGEKPPSLRDFKQNSQKHIGRLIDDKYWLGIKLPEKEVVDLYGNAATGGGLGMLKAPVPKI